MPAGGDWSKQSLWDERYAMVMKSDGEEDGALSRTFDWIVPPSHVLQDLRNLGTGTGEGILDVGCGNSTLCEELSSAGFTQVVGVDFSAEIVEAMRARAAEMQCASPPSYHAMDATSMSFSTASFAVCIDKGCLDAMLTPLDQAKR